MTRRTFLNGTRGDAGQVPCRRELPSVDVSTSTGHRCCLTGWVLGLVRSSAEGGGHDGWRGRRFASYGSRPEARSGAGRAHGADRRRLRGFQQGQDRGSGPRLAGLGISGGERDGEPPTEHRGPGLVGGRRGRRGDRHRASYCGRPDGGPSGCRCDACRSGLQGCRPGQGRPGQGHPGHAGESGGHGGQAELGGGDRLRRVRCPERGRRSGTGRRRARSGVTPTRSAAGNPRGGSDRRRDQSGVHL